MLAKGINPSDQKRQDKLVAEVAGRDTFGAIVEEYLTKLEEGGAAEATPITYQGQDGKQYVVITSTGGGFFGNPMTDDSIMAFALENSK